ncbi:MAG: Fur family transcriptional regulator [Myxococcota bacterium]
METSEQLAAFERHLQERGLKLTAQRRVIVECFFDGAKHVSLLEILNEVKAVRSSVGYATVYRTMRLLTDVGLAVEHKFGDGEARFEPRIPGEHHDHLICVTCGKIVEFEDPIIEARQDEVAIERGFDVVSHRLEIYVKCQPDCVQNDAGVAEHTGAN